MLQRYFLVGNDGMKNLLEQFMLVVNTKAGSNGATPNYHKISPKLQNCKFVIRNHKFKAVASVKHGDLKSVKLGEV